MGKHAVIGRSLVGHKNTTLKQGARHAANNRIRSARDMASEVTVETFDPDLLAATAVYVSNPFTGIDPITGQDFTQVGTNAYKLRVREGFVGLRSISVKPKDGKAFRVWIASYAGRQMPLLSNKGQALGFADAKDKLFALLIVESAPRKVTHVTPADKRDKVIKPYTGGAIEFAVCQVTLEPARICDHCH
jgi:hypothetical protein